MIQDPDYKLGIVPLSKRHGSLTMSLLWISMVVAFPTVLVGFDWYKKGFTLCQVLGCILIGCALVLAYQIPAGYLGAKTGQTYALLSRNVFGRWGSRFVSFAFLFFAIAWYGLNPLFLADGINTLLKLHMPLYVLAPLMALVMAFNNFFGFRGIANFARFLAAPVLILWVCSTFIFAVTHCPHQIVSGSHIESTFNPLSVISAVVIGYAVWGNEADYWRYSKPTILSTALPLIITLFLGWVIFGTTGWMLASIAGSSADTYTAAYQLTFGHMPLAGAVILALSYFASGDACLYGAINVCQNLKPMSHKMLVVVIAVIGSFTAALFSLSGCAKSVEFIASLSAVCLPVPMIIMLTDWLLHEHVLKAPRDFSRVPGFSELHPFRLPALIALLGGWTVGIATTGVIPGSEFLQVGISTLQAWLVAIGLYIPLKMFEYKRDCSYQQVCQQEVIDLANESGQ